MMSTDDLFEATPPAAATEDEGDAKQVHTLLSAVRTFMAAVGADPDASIPDNLIGVTEEEVAATCQRIVDAVKLTVQGITRPAVAPIEDQLASFTTWQKARGEYWTWPPDAMERLRAKLLEYGEGIETLPCYAYSIVVRLQDGKMVSIDRSGKVTPK